jgi:hypothetical protein
LLYRLQRLALQYFLDNQAANGLFLDRQSNHTGRRFGGLCSLAATGMGLIGLALASADPYRLLPPAEAVRRCRFCLETCLTRSPHDHGVVPHFVDAATGTGFGVDAFSTVETAWLAVGALWSAAWLGDPLLTDLARRLYDRIDWAYWTAGSTDGLLRHGKSANGRFLGCRWDRLNGETVFMYVLAAGAESDRALPGHTWVVLRPCHGTVGGQHFNNADLGLFVFQYGLDLLDLARWQTPSGLDLHGDAQRAALANREVCRALAPVHETYRHFWGLSAGDGPPDPGTAQTEAYRCYAPGGPIDGTAHLTATLASVASTPHEVLENLTATTRFPGLCGRYGFSNVNLGHEWLAPDMVGIDAGAAVLALDNFLVENRVRSVFHTLPCVRRGLEQLGFRDTLANSRPADVLLTIRQAS